MVKLLEMTVPVLQAALYLAAGVLLLTYWLQTRFCAEQQQLGTPTWAPNGLNTGSGSITAPAAIHADTRKALRNRARDGAADVKIDVLRPPLDQKLADSPDTVRTIGNLDTKTPGVRVLGVDAPHAPDDGLYSFDARPSSKEYWQCLSSGSWSETALDPYLTYQETCPELQTNYLCDKTHRASMARFVYRPPPTCPLMSLEESHFGKDDGCLAGKTISIVGDSLPHQLFYSLECRARQHIKERRVLRTYLFKGEEREKETLTTFNNGMRLHYYFIGNNDNVTEHPLNSYAKANDFLAKAFHGTDVLITNLCVFHYSDVEYQREARTEKILSYGPALQKFGGRVVIFGAPTKHVNERGYHHCARDDIKLSWLTHWAEKQKEGMISHKNTALRWLALKYDLDFVDTETITKDRLDAHVSEMDCSHYCQPGTWRTTL